MFHMKCEPARTTTTTTTKLCWEGKRKLHDLIFNQTICFHFKSWEKSERKSFFNVARENLSKRCRQWKACDPPTRGREKNRSNEINAFDSWRVSSPTSSHKSTIKAQMALLSTSLEKPSEKCVPSTWTEHSALINDSICLNARLFVRLPSRLPTCSQSEMEKL